MQRLFPQGWTGLINKISGFLGKLQFETHSKKLPLVAILKNFKTLFEKNHFNFPKYPQILMVLRILFQSHSTAKELQISEK